MANLAPYPRVTTLFERNPLVHSKGNLHTFILQSESRIYTTESR